MKIHYIYKICVGEEVVYVGRTIYPQRRFTEHYNYSYFLKTMPEDKKSLVSLIVIEECNNSITASDREKFWIDHYSRLGHGLNNIRKHDNSKRNPNKKERHFCVPVTMEERVYILLNIDKEGFLCGIPESKELIKRALNKHALREHIYKKIFPKNNK